MYNYIILSCCTINRGEIREIYLIKQQKDIKNFRYEFKKDFKLKPFQLFFKLFYKKIDKIDLMVIKWKVAN